MFEHLKCFSYRCSLNLKLFQVDLRAGWNSIVAGFSGVWHYVNISDFEYSYKLYTPIEGLEENGIVAKLIFKEGLDFEVSLKLSENRVSIRVLWRPNLSSERGFIIYLDWVMPGYPRYFANHPLANFPVLFIDRARAIWDVEMRNPRSKTFGLVSARCQCYRI